LLEDHIYPSANEYVRLVQSLGAEIFYLTGRPDRAMREGTVRALAHWNFPLVSDSHLIMKPSEIQTDESFKAIELQKMCEMGFDYIWFFENEPVIIEQVREKLPQVRIVFVNSVHAGRAIAPTDLPSIGMSYAEGLLKR
jgi:predicted secreted acid phosphatase